MNAKTANALKGVGGIALAGVLVWISFRSVDVDAFKEGLKSCNLAWVAVSMLCGVFALVLRGLRWSQMLMPLDPEEKFFPVFNAFNVGNIFSFAIPGTGEFVRSGLVTSKTATYEKVLGTEVAERILDMLCMFIILGIVLLLSGGATSEFFSEHVVQAFIAGLTLRKGIIAGVVIMILIALGITISRLRERVPVFGKICGLVAGLGKGIAAIRLVEKKWLFALYTLLLWLAYWAEVQAILFAVPGVGNLTPFDTLFISVLGSFASVIPAPGGMGAYHYLIATAMTGLYASTWDGGILFATLIHEPHNLMLLIVGGISALFVKRVKK